MKGNSAISFSHDWLDTADTPNVNEVSRGMKVNCSRNRCRVVPADRYDVLRNDEIMYIAAFGAKLVLHNLQKADFAYSAFSIHMYNIIYMLLLLHKNLNFLTLSFYTDYIF